MKHSITILAFCLIVTGGLGRDVNVMTYEQMWASADSVFIGHVERVTPLADFDAPKTFGTKAGLKCYALTIRVHCVLKGAKMSEAHIRSYDYLRSGDPKKDVLLDLNPPAFLADAGDLVETDALWFLLQGEPVTGQMDARLAVIPISTDYLRPEHWPIQPPQCNAGSRPLSGDSPASEIVAAGGSPLPAVRY